MSETETERGEEKKGEATKTEEGREGHAHIHTETEGGDREPDKKTETERKEGIRNRQILAMVTICGKTF